LGASTDILFYFVQVVFRWRVMLPQCTAAKTAAAAAAE
jgi:hypothetical protein